MKRRAFLAGLLATAATGVVARQLPAYVLRTTIPPGPVYGRSPAMDVLPEIRAINRYAAASIQTFVYGNPNAYPMQFSGFEMFADTN